MKKLLSYRGLMGFIYALVMLLPFSAIGLRCAYVTFNKNAYQSYSDKSAMTTTLISNNNQSIVGNNYIINLLSSGESYSDNIYFNSSTIDFSYLYGQTISFNVVGFRFYPNNTHFRLLDENNNSYNFELNDEKRTYLNGQSFNWRTGNLVNSNGNQPVRFYMVTYTTGSLDNAFDYSLQSFLDENGVGRLNLTNWFVDIFLDNTTHNMLYINYINWYMNYSLLVSCVYLLYLVLMWFITLARRLLTSFDEKGSLGS